MHNLDDGDEVECEHYNDGEFVHVEPTESTDKKKAHRNSDEYYR